MVYVRNALLLLSSFLIVNVSVAVTASIPSYTEIRSGFTDWKKQFIADVRSFRKSYVKNKTVNKNEIEKLFLKSLAPNSNMLRLFDFWTRKKHICTRGPSPVGCMGSPDVLLATLLENAKAVSSGGTHSDLKGLIVYINLGRRNMGPYSKNTPPKTATLVRGYPFLVFQKVNGKIMLVSISKELWKIMSLARLKIFTDIFQKKMGSDPISSINRS